MDSGEPQARSTPTSRARIDPTIWRESEVTRLVERAREGGLAERLELLQACVERFQAIVRRIIREDGFGRVAPSATEIVHEVFLQDLQAVLDCRSISEIRRGDLERLFVHKVRQHLLKLVERMRRSSAGEHDRPPAGEQDREHPGSAPTRRPDLVVERLEREAMLLKSLDEFPDEETRDLLVQRYYFDRSLAELSGITGLPISTLHSRIRAAERRLGRMCVAGGEAIPDRETGGHEGRGA